MWVCKNTIKNERERGRGRVDHFASLVFRTVRTDESTCAFARGLVHQASCY